MAQSRGVWADPAQRHRGFLQRSQSCIKHSEVVQRWRFLAGSGFGLALPTVEMITEMIMMTDSGQLF